MKYHLFTVSFLVQFISFGKACEFDASLLSCPIQSSQDFVYLNDLAEAGFNIDIFPENLTLPADNVEILADREALNLLVSQRGCHVVEEFYPPSAPQTGSSFQLNSREESVLGPEFHNDFRSYQNILDQLKFYSENHPEGVQIEVKNIGKSHEDRNLQVIHINSAGSNFGDKPVVFIMATQHAREWIAASTALFFIDKLLNREADILNRFDFAVLPLANPDGYEYSRNFCRLWRKNRRYPAGVDMNRNWNINWSKSGSSTNPGSQVYHGPGPASEPEIRAIQNYILSLPNTLVGFDLHSYGQLILRNYCWTRSPCPHEKFFAFIGNEMRNAISEVFGKEYKSIRGSNLYPASGGAIDWMYSVAGFPGFTLELRDQGRFGFQLPTSEIVPVGEEIFAAIVTAIYSLKQGEVYGFEELGEELNR